MTRLVLTFEEVGDQLAGVSARTVRRMVSRGELPVVHIGQRVGLPLIGPVRFFMGLLLLGVRAAFILAPPSFLNFQTRKAVRISNPPEPCPTKLLAWYMASSPAAV